MLPPSYTLNLSNSSLSFSISLSVSALNMDVLMFLSGIGDATSVYSPFPDNYNGPPLDLILSQRMGDFFNTCKGLFYFYNQDGDAVLWNPSTNVARIIPDSLNIPIPPHVRSEPTRIATGEICCSGLGYDSKSSDFKIIRMIQYEIMGDDDDEHEHEQECGCLPFHGFTRQGELYSLKSDSWKPISDAPDGIYTHPSTYVNECFYWCDMVTGTNYHNIHCFDFCDETFSCFPSSQISHSLDRTYCCITPLKFLNSLAILAEKGSPTSTHICYELWRMIEDDRSRWCKVFDFRVEVYEVGLEFEPPVIPIGSFIKDGRDVLFLARSCGEIFTYDWVTKEMKTMGRIDFKGYDVHRTILISCDPCYVDLLQREKQKKLKDKMSMHEEKEYKRRLGKNRG